jgi:hypothetical protein
LICTPGEAVAVHREARDLLVGEARADRQRIELAALLEQLAEALAVARLDVDEAGELVDQFVERPRGGRRDLERVGRVVVREHDAVAIEDQAAVRRDRHDRDPVLLGERQVVVVLDHLQVEEPQQQHEEQEHDASRADGEPPVEALQLVRQVAHLDAAGVRTKARGARRPQDHPAREALEPHAQPRRAAGDLDAAGLRGRKPDRARDRGRERRKGHSNRGRRNIAGGSRD